MEASLLAILLYTQRAIHMSRASAPSSLGLRTWRDPHVGNTIIGRGGVHATGWEINVGTTWKLYEWPHAFMGNGQLVMPPAGLVGRYVNGESYMRAEPVIVNRAINRYYSI